MTLDGQFQVYYETDSAAHAQTPGSDAELEPNRPPIRIRTRGGLSDPNPNRAVGGTDPNPNPEC